jgi:catechol-2,3-dioxygenase
MLSDKKLKAFVPTVKSAEAKIFYQHLLGLTLLSEDNFALEFDANGTSLRIIIVPELKPQLFTVAGWDVDNISSTAFALSSRGVIFEKYAQLEQDALGIWTSPGGSKVAWFKDPDGNILSISEIK